MWRRFLVRWCRLLTLARRTAVELLVIGDWDRLVAAAERDLAWLHRCPGSGLEADLRQDAVILSRQRMMGRALDGTGNRPLVCELHLGLGGMDIDVDLRWVNLDANHPKRMPPDHEQAVVGVFERVHQ